MDPLFWKGKKVFLTGHTGFKGSWLSLWLSSLGASVTGYSLLPPSEPNLFELARVGEDIVSINEDIRDAEKLANALILASPDIVIHMAAQALVSSSYFDPVETYSTNVMGLVNLLEAVKKTDSVRAVVNITSDKCYENKEWVWSYREDEPMGGHDPYSCSKGCAELVTASYRHSYFKKEEYDKHGVAIATARAGNVIGGGDWAKNRLVPDILASLEANEPVVIRSPNAIRPWQHVLEPLNGYLTLAEKLYLQGCDYADAWNFGPDDSGSRTVRWIVENLTESWGKESQWKLSEVVSPHEANLLKLDSSKSRSLLGWHPIWGLEEALVKICSWHRSYVAGSCVKDATLRQIIVFQNEIEAAC